MSDSNHDFLPGETDLSAPTIVVFRVWRNEDKSVLALFPCEPAHHADLSCSSYAHLGQHGAADYLGCIRRTRPATPAEYADLKRELETYGDEDNHYVLDVRQRAPHDWRERIRAQQHAMQRAVA